MHKITRSHEIDAGHRVCGHAGKCQHLHGHRYKFDLTCAALGGLDDLGMVIDFAVIKDRLCVWLDENWDHRMLIWTHDPMLAAMRDIDPAVVSVPFNPTAECIAEHIVMFVGPNELASTGVQLIACTVHETGKCSATFDLPGDDR